MPIGGNGKPTKICCHAFIGKDKDGAVRAAKILPWTICCWNCGDGKKGSYKVDVQLCRRNISVYLESDCGSTAERISSSNRKTVC